MNNFLYIRLIEPGGCNDANPSGSSVLTVRFELPTSRLAEQIRGANHCATSPLINKSEQNADSEMVSMTGILVVCKEFLIEAIGH